MIRILHVLCDLSGGGAERLVLELARAPLRGVTQTVATVMGGGALEPAYRAVGVPLVMGERRRGRPSARALARLVEAVKAHDVVHTHLFAGDLWGQVAATLAGHPNVVSTEHNTDLDETWQRRVRRAVNARSRVVVAVSAAAAARVEGARDVRVIPNGVDPERFARPHIGSDGRSVLAIGRHAPQKGFDVLVRALPEDMRLSVAGSLPAQPPSPAGAGTPNVRWLGPREDIPELLAGADILAVPSRWEGFGLAALEGLAAGVPVVASAVGGLVEVVGDAGVLVPPEDPRALREALARLRDDPDTRARLGQAGRARARAYTLARTIDAYAALWQEIAGGPAEPSR